MFALLAISLALGAEAPWEGEPFAADPQALAKAAAALPAPEAGAELDLLLEDVTMSFDERGRVVQTWRLVYRPLTVAAARNWSTTSTAYAPWHQARPKIRVRVVRPDGGVHWLDPATLTDSPAIERRPEVFSDWRVLRGPIPGVDKDVVVEEVITVRDTAPFFDAGTVTQVVAFRSIPARRWRLRVEAPRSLALRHEEVDLPKPLGATEGDRSILSWDICPLEGVKPIEPFAPREGARPRRVAIATARSWQEVARAYSAIVDRQLGGTDLVATAREIVSPGDSPAAAARKVLAWIESRVRYTGLELGDAAIVPARPAEVLSRRYGDCKDLSLLAVALLRAAGHAASIALLRTAWDEVSPALPGLGQFDHAVVRVGGRSPAWLDPTVPGGEISSQAEGRLALVASLETTGLTRAPERAGSDNRILKTRRILLSEDGWAKAAEETQGWGVFAAELRGASRDVNKSEGQDTARQRLAVPDGGEARVRYELRGPPGAVPVQVMEADVSRWATTKEHGAEAVVPPRPVFWSLPGIFRTEALERGAEDRGPPPRKAGVLLPLAYQAEVHYLVSPPPGFQAGTLPGGERVSFGPATYESIFTVGKDGAVDVTYRFGVSRRQVTLDEFQAMWWGVAKLTREEGPRIQFQRTSQILLAAGKGREALDEIRRLAALHPFEVNHRIHLALALLRLGLGDAARAEARRVIEAESESEWAWRVLSSVLSHDLLGRAMKPGADLEGAIAAKRRARDLSPRAAGTRARLASLLETGRELERFGPGARLDEALSEYRFVREDLGTRDHDVDYALALFHAGRPAEALPLARGAPRGLERDAVLLAAAAVVEGVEGALRAAAGWEADERLKGVMQAVRELARRGRYPEAGNLILGTAGAAALDARTRELGTILARARPPAFSASDRADPAKLPRRFFQAFAADDLVPALKDLFPAHLRGEFDAPEARLLRPPQTEELLGFGLRAALEIAGAALDVRVEGDGPPWLIHVAARPPGKRDTLVLMAELEDGEARLLSIQPQPSEFGAEAMRSAGRGDLPAARRLLGWARQALGPAEPSAWSAAGVLAATWVSGEAAGIAEMQRAGAALAAFGTRGGEALPVLEREWPMSFGTMHKALAFALLHALGKADGSGVDSSIAAADQVRSEYPEIGRAVFQAKVQVLRRGRRHRELRSLAEARLKAIPQDFDALRAQYDAANALGDIAGVGEATRAILSSKDPDATNLNNAAWYLLFETPVPPEALGTARRAAEKPGGGAPAILHTLATAEAIAGNPAAAMAALQRGVGPVRAELAGSDWLVVGLVAERYGEREAAQAAYRRVTAPAEPRATDSSVLARRRLAAMSADRTP